MRRVLLDQMKGASSPVSHNAQPGTSTKPHKCEDNSPSPMLPSSRLYLETHWIPIYFLFSSKTGTQNLPSLYKKIHFDYQLKWIYFCLLPCLTIYRPEAVDCRVAFCLAQDLNSIIHCCEEDGSPMAFLLDYWDVPAHWNEIKKRNITF